jgi:hypothetical protein
MKVFITANMKNSKSHGKQEVYVYMALAWWLVHVSPLSRFTAHLLPVYRATYKWTSGGILSTCQSHISNIKSFLPVEAEITVTKVFITANMKNSKSHCKRRSMQHLVCFHHCSLNWYTIAMNFNKNLIEPKPYMNPTKNLIEPKPYMKWDSCKVYVLSGF